MVIRLRLLVGLVLLLSEADGKSLDKDFAAFSFRISSKVLMWICSGAFFESVVISAVV